MHEDAAVPVAVLGASGFSGAEALRLLAGHPAFSVVAAGAGDAAGRPVADLYPHLAPAYGDVVFSKVGGPEDLAGAGAALVALPHEEAARAVPPLVESGVRVVDLSGAFRLAAEAYPAWYGFEHPSPGWPGKAVYGLPEMFADEIAGAELVANPGCYPTAVALALAPLLSEGLLDPAHVTIDAKSGVSGAGRKPSDFVHHAMTEGSVRPYRVGTHQHTPEIEQVLERAGGTPVAVTFVPHLVPAVRGVLVTCYARLAHPATTEDLVGALTESHSGAPFVRVLPAGSMPDPKRVAGSNVCEVGAVADPRTGTAVAVGAVDNLVKGAAGQAIQNLNLMHGLDQAAGLPVLGVYP